jgi:hypothetical protein
VILGVYGLCDGLIDWFSSFGEEGVYFSISVFYFFYYLFAFTCFLIKWSIVLIPGLVSFVLIALVGIISRLILKDRFLALFASYGSCAILNIAIFLLGQPLIEGFPFKIDLPKHVFVIIIIAELIVYPIICIYKPKIKKSKYLINKGLEYEPIFENKFVNLKNKIHMNNIKTPNIQRNISYERMNDYIDRKNRIDRRYNLLNYPDLNRNDISFIEFLVEGNKILDFYWVKKITNLSEELLTKILEEILELKINNGKIMPIIYED